MRPLTLLLLLVLLAAGCFALATTLEPRVAQWTAAADSGDVLKILLGDSRRIFANHAFVQADVYFHSGYYPSVFDQAQAPKDSRHMTAKEGSTEAEEHEKSMNFLGPPRDWIERFGRRFLITEHTHLESGKEREILPWLKLSAELDPQRIDSYVVAAYWLRRELGKPAEAEKFLRDGLRNNPRSYELLFELGQLYNEDYHEPARARPVWELALRRWSEQEGTKKEPDLVLLEKITINLARLEENAGNYAQAIAYLELAIKASPYPQALQQQIADLKRRLRTPSAPAPQSPTPGRDRD